MRRWQLAALVLGPAALFCAAQPARAQVIIGGLPPIVVTPAPIVVAPGWGARPYRGGRRYWRGYRRGGWYAAARGPRGRYVAFGRRW
jgi:hypothetical protein